MYDIFPASGCRSVLLALQVTINRIIGNRNAAGVLEGLHIASDLVGSGAQSALVGVEKDIALDLHLVNLCRAALHNLDTSA